MSPVVDPPVSTAYCSLSRAPPPVSVKYHPVGRTVLVVLRSVFESVLKFSVEATPEDVRLTDPVPVSAPPLGPRIGSLPGDWAVLLAGASVTMACPVCGAATSARFHQSDWINPPSWS